ncbi:hypothetical protein BGX27_003043 [Mortierella sp. AM989]|nr:hypothetical protein BGX27_003043 [Mortierella sp. AM989]
MGTYALSVPSLKQPLFHDSSYLSGAQQSTLKETPIANSSVANASRLGGHIRDNIKIHTTTVGHEGSKTQGTKVVSCIAGTEVASRKVRVREGMESGKVEMDSENMFENVTDAPKEKKISQVKRQDKCACEKETDGNGTKDHLSNNDIESHDLDGDGLVGGSLSIDNEPPGTFKKPLVIISTVIGSILVAAFISTLVYFHKRQTRRRAGACDEHMSRKVNPTYDQTFSNHALPVIDRDNDRYIACYSDDKFIPPIAELDQWSSPQRYSQVRCHQQRLRQNQYQQENGSSWASSMPYAVSMPAQVYDQDSIPHSYSKEADRPYGSMDHVYRRHSQVHPFSIRGQQYYPLEPRNYYKCDRYTSFTIPQYDFQASYSPTLDAACGYTQTASSSSSQSSRASLPSPLMPMLYGNVRGMPRVRMSWSNISIENLGSASPREFTPAPRRISDLILSERTTDPIYYPDTHVGDDMSFGHATVRRTRSLQVE